jgi:hypothetical protein
VDALLVEPGNEEQLASAIGRLVGDSVLCKKLVNAGLQRADDFSMQRLANEYVAIYQRLLVAEKNDEILVRPNKLLAMFEHRVLRRTKGGSN